MLFICSLERAEGIFGYSSENDGQLNDMREEHIKSIGINERILNWWPKRCCRTSKKNCGVPKYLKEFSSRGFID
jgi:hypothetical protein